MKRLVIFTCFTFVVISLLTVGCDQPQNQRVSPAVVEKPKPDVSNVVAHAVQLREEKMFLVTLEFKKEQLTFDLWKLAKNEMAAEQRTLIVGERTFNQYQIGKKVSGVGDVGGFIFNGEIAEYTIRPVEKTIKSQYFWIANTGEQTELNKDEYNEALGQIVARGRYVLTVPYAGTNLTYVLEESISSFKFVERQPLNRYFVTVKVENTTFTLSITKLIRNAANTHEITMEVPREIYLKTGDAWNNQLSTGSFILKGHLSELHGKVVKKWSEVDSGYQLVKTADGRQFITPKL